MAGLQVTRAPLAAERQIRQPVIFKTRALDSRVLREYTCDVEFEWDTKKAEYNLKTHKVSFPEATTVFGDPLGMTVQDPDHSVDESRFVTIGHSDRNQLLIVSHTHLGRRVRIISVRRLTASERKTYEENHER